MKIKSGLLRRHLRTVSDLIDEGFSMIKTKDTPSAIEKLELALRHGAGLEGLETYWAKFKIHWALSYCYAKTFENCSCGQCMNEIERRHWILSTYHCRLQLDCSRLDAYFEWQAKERLIALYIKRGYLRLAIQLIENFVKDCPELTRKQKLKYQVGSLWQCMGSGAGQGGGGACSSCKLRATFNGCQELDNLESRSVLFKRAIDAFQCVLDGFSPESLKAEKFQQLKGRTLGSIGNCFFYMDDYVSAIFYYNERLTVSQKLSDVRGQCRANYNLGNAYIALDKIQIACQYYAKAIECSSNQPRSSSSLTDTAIYSCALASAYNLNKQYHMVIRWFRSALSQLSASRSISGSRADVGCEEYAFEGLIKAYQALGDSITATRLSKQRASFVGRAGRADKTQTNDDDEDDLTYLMSRMHAGCILLRLGLRGIVIIIDRRVSATDRRPAIGDLRNHDNYHDYARIRISEIFPGLIG